MATVESDANGNLVLNDPVALAMMEVIAKHNCRETLKMQMDRVKHFQEKIKIKGHDPKMVAIIVANVNTKLGEVIADKLMPNYDWKGIRDVGEIPFARGIVMRQGFADMIPGLTEAIDPVIVVDHDIIALFVAGDY